MTKETLFKWEAIVRDYELDAQGIVNNATYLNYFEQCRTLYARSIGIDYLALHDAGFDLVVASLEVHYRRPLRARDAFYATASIQSYDAKRIHFDQAIYLQEANKLAANASIHIACVDYKTGKSGLPEILIQMLK